MVVFDRSVASDSMSSVKKGLVTHANSSFVIQDVANLLLFASFS